MTLIDWAAGEHLVGVAEMDATHGEFAELLNAVDAKSADDEFVIAFEALVEHTRVHFAHEDVLMTRCYFPPIEIHKGEHRRVMAEMDRFLATAKAGNVAFARAYVRETLPDWFARHAATMDSALAWSLRAAGIS